MGWWTGEVVRLSGWVGLRGWDDGIEKRRIGRKDGKREKMRKEDVKRERVRKKGRRMRRIRGRWKKDEKRIRKKGRKMNEWGERRRMRKKNMGKMGEYRMKKRGRLKMINIEKKINKSEEDKS